MFFHESSCFQNSKSRYFYAQIMGYLPDSSDGGKNTGEFARFWCSNRGYLAKNLVLENINIENNCIIFYIRKDCTKCIEKIEH